ncbi:hypothetical protein C8Q74DRAFT_1215064 [Fomes fomentarius]|nr:hypothetical protein C8Q74DRAFT_1215064 [Fomes fomentarius]
MRTCQSFVLLLAAAGSALAATGPLAHKRATDDNCNNSIGDCFSNGCAPQFANPSNTIGTCTAGTYNGCPCEKCGGGQGNVGGCQDNGCAGFQGTCTQGQYQGCPCN